MGLILDFRVGRLYIVLTYDEDRLDQILGGANFPEKYLLDIDSLKTYLYRDGALTPLKITRVEQDGKERRELVPADYFLRAMLPQRTGPCLVVIHVKERVLGGRYKVRPLSNAAIVVVTGNLDNLHERIISYATHPIQDAYLADSDELRALLGYGHERLHAFTGLTYGEAKELAEEKKKGAGFESLSKRAFELKTFRLMSIGVKTDEPVGDIYSAFIDMPYKQVLKNYVDSGAVCFIGPPGSGKTYMASKLICTRYERPFVMEAGRILEKGGEAVFAQALTYLKAMGRIGFLINEYDHLISDRRLYTRMLRFLEERGEILLCTTILDPSSVMRKYDSTFVNEALRPGRFDEIIPVIPPTESEVRLGMVLEIYQKLRRRGKIGQLNIDDMKRIAFAAPLLYPSDYESLLLKYFQDPGNLQKFLDDYDPEQRLKTIEYLLDNCRKLGNTSATLIEQLENTLFSLQI